MITISFPAASRILTTSAVFLDIPPKLPRVAILRINTPSSMVSSFIRIRSPKIAPPENGLLGSTAIMPTDLPRLRYSLVSLSVSVLFPAPGGPVIPMTYALPVCGYSFCMISVASSYSFSTVVMARDMASLEPFSNSVTMSIKAPPKEKSCGDGQKPAAPHHKRMS